METETEADLYVGLPIVAYADRRKHLRKIVLFAYFAAIGAFMSFCAIAAPFVEVPLFVKLLSPPMILISAPLLGWAVPMALTLVGDLRIRGPVLTIDRNGFADRRSGASIEWSEIRSIRLVDSPPGVNSELISGVTIRLKDKAKLPRLTWKRWIKPLLTKPDEFHCSLFLLTEPADPLAWKMKDLVKHAGGAFWNPRGPYPMWRAAVELYTGLLRTHFKSCQGGGKRRIPDPTP